MAKVSVFSNSGDEVTGRQTLIGIVWTGATTAGDTCIVKERLAGRVWEGRATGTNTYIGISYPDDGIVSEGGFEVESIDSGTVYLYLREI